MFGGDTGQEAFYQATAAPMVRQLTRALQSSVLMAYGISAAGKTHTIEARRLGQPSCSLASRVYDSKYAHDLVSNRPKCHCGSHQAYVPQHGR